MKKKGFTLLEMLIVLTIVGIILPAVFAIMFVIMRQQVRIYRVTETRRQGDFMLSFIKDKLIRTRQIANNPALPTVPTPYCTTIGSSHDDSSLVPGPGANISFLDQDDIRYRLFLNTTTNNLNYQVDPQNAGLTTPLNSSNIRVTNFDIQCFRRGSYSAPLISITYDVTFIDNTPTTEEGTVTFHYQTKIKLR